MLEILFFGGDFDQIASDIYLTVKCLFLFVIFFNIFLYFLCASKILFSLTADCNRSAFVNASYISWTFLHMLLRVLTYNLFIINYFYLLMSSLSTIIFSPYLKYLAFKSERMCQISPDFDLIFYKIISWSSCASLFTSY